MSYLKCINPNIVEVIKQKTKKLKFLDGHHALDFAVSKQVLAITKHFFRERFGLLLLISDYGNSD